MIRQKAWQVLRTQGSKTHNNITITKSLAVRTYAKAGSPSSSVRATTYKRGPTPAPKVQPVAPKTRVASDRPVTSASGIENQPSPLQGKRPTLESSPKPLQEVETAAEPLAQKSNLDSPSTDSIRHETQQEQAAAENTTTPESVAPQQPLPDLRQGIPSTFDFEFGKGKKDRQIEIAEETDGKRGEEEDYSRADFQTSIDRRRETQLRWMYVVIVGACVFGATYFARPFGGAEDVPAGLDTSDVEGWAPGKMYRRVQARLGDRLGYYTEPSFPKLLPDVPLTQRPPFTLVLSLEDLMVHSSWDRTHGYRMAKRPGIDYFIRYLSPYYELVLFTSVPIGIADPVIKKLDPYHFIMWPLGREATKYENGEFVKDLSYLNRDLKKTLIIDTVAGHVKNQPENAIVLPKWSGDPKDASTNDLVALIPFLEYVATMSIDDVRDVIKSFEGKHIPTEFARREAIAREQFNKQLSAERAKKPKVSLGSVLGGGLGIKADRAGSMMLSEGQTVAEGLAQGKMLSDQIREQGQKQYEYLEKQIQEQGAKWLKDEEEEQKRLMDEEMKRLKKNPVGGLARFFGGGEPPKQE